MARGKTFNARLVFRHRASAAIVAACICTAILAALFYATNPSYMLGAILIRATANVLFWALVKTRTDNRPARPRAATNLHRDRMHLHRTLHLRRRVISQAVEETRTGALTARATSVNWRAAETWRTRSSILIRRAA
jgi:hypothetical protein